MMAEGYPIALPPNRTIIALSPYPGLATRQPGVLAHSATAAAPRQVAFPET